MGLFGNIFKKFSQKPVDWDEMEELLIRADLGMPAVEKILAAARKKAGWRPGADEASQFCRDVVAEILREADAKQEKEDLQVENNKLWLSLIVGINGVGKTTSCAKLAHFLREKHSARPLLVAADTFRAAAIEQLELWANRLNIQIFKGEENSDPSSVCYRSIDYARENDLTHIICDTAGRLHTRHNLMEELKKIRRVVSKKAGSEPQETLLVVDAGAGVNSLTQARVFNEATTLSGCILTKLDGSGKGGCAVAIAEELTLLPRFVGTGEKAEDFDFFSIQKFCQGLT